jgi:MraZ protein
MEQDYALRGNEPAKIDDKGRLKIPNAFRALVEEHYGRWVFVTSIVGDCVRIYPLAVWIEIERKLAGMPTTHPSRIKYLTRANYFGQSAEIDNQGRVLIHPRLRDSAAMTGEVDVFGQLNHLEIWNHERLVHQLGSEPYTDDDARALAQFGI